MSRLSLLLLGLLLPSFCLLASSCRPKAAEIGAQTAGGPVGDPVPGDWIVERMEGEPATLNPLLEQGTAVTVLVTDGNIFESMVRRNYETLEWEPMLADKWETTEDHLVYTFHLNPAAKFSDGKPLTSADVKFTFDAVLNPANDTATARSYFTNVAAVETPDDQTIIIRCSNPYFMHFEQFGSLWILPKHVYGQGDFNTLEANRKPVGSGPFKFLSWDTGSQLTLVKRDDYWASGADAQGHAAARVPYVNRLMWKFISDDNAAFQVLQQQQVDTMRIGPEKWVTEAAKPGFEQKFNKFELYSPVNGYLGSFGWIGWNMRRPMFADKKVRQALTMLLDRQTILDTIFHGMGRVVSGYDFPDSPEYDPNIKPWPFDPKQAMQQLDEAGWKDSNNDGLRDKDGVEFRFEWIFNGGTPEYERLATVYKEQLKKAGIEVIIRPLDWPTFTDSITKRNFDACMMAWVSPPESDPYQIWHSSQAESGSNYVNFNVPEADQLILDARVEFDKDKRAAMYRRLHAILHEEQPYLFLFNTKRKIAIDKRFQDVKPLPLGFDIYNWWVPQNMQRYSAN